MREGIMRYFNIIRRLSKKLFFEKMKSDVTVLLYHRILENNKEDNLLPAIVNADPEEFEKELKFLIRNFNIISSTHAINSLRRNKQLPNRSLVITFDDGYRDNYLNAFPVLKKYKVPATIFLTSDFIDTKDLIWTDKLAYMINNTAKASLTIHGLGSYSLIGRNRKDRAKIAMIGYLKSIDDSEKNKIINSLSRDLDVYFDAERGQGLYLSSEEICGMNKSGITFGSHGASHSVLTRIAREKLEEELVKSKIKIEKIISNKVELFAYPHGDYSDFDSSIIESLKKAGYSAAFTAIAGDNRITNKDEIFSLKRIPAGRSIAGLKKNLFLYT